MSSGAQLACSVPITASNSWLLRSMRLTNLVTDGPLNGHTSSTLLRTHHDPDRANAEDDEPKTKNTHTNNLRILYTLILFILSIPPGRVKISA